MIVTALAVANVLCTGCVSDGLDEHDVLASLVEHRAEFDELRSMVQHDAETVDLRRVSADAEARCGEPEDGQACLAGDRRGNYARRMRKAGVRWIDRERDPTRIYFVFNYRPVVMDARLRGLVFAADVVDPGRLQPRQEWRAISEGWYTYLMIDS